MWCSSESLQTQSFQALWGLRGIHSHVAAGISEMAAGMPHVALHLRVMSDILSCKADMCWQRRCAPVLLLQILGFVGSTVSTLLSYGRILETSRHSFIGGNSAL